MAVAGTAPIIRAKRSRGVSCAGSKAAASIAATATSITTAACIAAGIGTAAMVIATVGMTTIEHPRVDEGLPYGSPFLLRRSPAARPELLSVLFAKLQRRQRLGGAAPRIPCCHHHHSRNRWKSASPGQARRDRRVELENAAHGRLVHHLPFGVLNDGRFVGAEIGFEYLVVLAPFPALVNQD